MRRSDFPGGVPTVGVYYKSSHSADTPDNCVEVAVFDSDGTSVGVRDSKLGDGSPVLRLPGRSLAAAISAIRSGVLA